MPLSKRDRSLLRGLVAAMILGVGGSLGLAASCFGRDTAHREVDSVSQFPEDQSARTSGGGVRGEEVEEVVGTTEVTAAELPPGGPAAATTNAVSPPVPNASTADVPAPYTPTIETTPRPAPAATPPAASAPPASTPAATPTETPVATDAGAVPAAPTSAPVDAGAPSAAATFSNPLAPTPFSPDIGAGGFTEPPLYGASAWVPNQEAGAGPFTTERNVPDQPGP